MNIAVVGAYGKLGALIVHRLKKSHSVVCIDKHNGLDNLPNIVCDAVIDASVAWQSVETAKFCGQNKIPLLIACTGQSPKQISQIEEHCKKIAWCICPNLSVGIAFVAKSLKNVAMLNSPSICITETHHIKKLDKPSGTAIMLKNVMQQQLEVPVYISSVRKGDCVGTHEITISLPFEEIEISHKATNRNVYAFGAVFAIEKLMGKPCGRYTFEQLLENEYD